MVVISQTSAQRQAKRMAKLREYEAIVKGKGKMFDIKKVEEEARKEIAEEQAKAAKGKIKDKLAQISKARAVVQQLEREYEVMIQEVGADVG